MGYFDIRGFNEEFERRLDEPDHLYLRPLRVYRRQDLRLLYIKLRDENQLLRAELQKLQAAP